MDPGKNGIDCPEKIPGKNGIDFPHFELVRKINDMHVRSTSETDYCGEGDFISNNRSGRSQT